MQNLEAVEAKLNEQQARGQEALEGLFLRCVQSIVKVCDSAKQEDGDVAEPGLLPLPPAAAKAWSVQPVASSNTRPAACVIVLLFLLVE